MISHSTILDLLQQAGLTGDLLVNAHDTLLQARDKAKGLFWSKWRVRLFKAGKIAGMLSWSDERLLDVRPELAAWDIAPVINVTAHGDNVPWINTNDGPRPVPGAWMTDTIAAREANYWCPGEHPRSERSRKAWYRRNAGEFEAWSRGKAVDVAHARLFRANGVTVRECNGAWQLDAHIKLLGFIPANVRIGYEISNVWRESDGAQLWYPIPGYELRAPLTWSVIPGRKKD